MAILNFRALRRRIDEEVNKRVTFSSARVHKGDRWRLSVLRGIVLERKFIFAEISAGRHVCDARRTSIADILVGD